MADRRRDRASGCCLESLEQRVLLTANGLTGTYYDTNNFTGSSVTRVDAAVDFNWGGGAPVAGFNSDHNSVRWTGRIHADAAGTYQVRVGGDDGVRVYLNDQLVLDDWSDHAFRYTAPADVAFASGGSRKVQIDYYERTGQSRVVLEWKRPGMSAWEVIPTGNLLALTTATTRQLPYASAKDLRDDYLQAEDYDTGGQGIAWNDLTAGNFNGKYRADDVEVDVSNDRDAGHRVNFAAGEWAEYTVHASAGQYVVKARIAAHQAAPGALNVYLDGQLLTTLDVQSTGGYANWTTLVSQPFTVHDSSAGKVRLEAVGGDPFSVNWVKFERAGRTLNLSNNLQVGVFTYSNLDAWRNTSGGKLANHMFYMNMNGDGSTASGAFAKAYAAGATPWVKLSPVRAGYAPGEANAGLIYKHILQGQYDAWLTNYTSMLKANTTGAFWFDFAHEMNGPWKEYSVQATGNNAQANKDFIAAWRYVYDFFKAANVNNAVWVWAPERLRDGESIQDLHHLAKLYPGDDYVDYIGFSVYASGDNTTASFQSLFDRSYTEVQTFMPNKPIVISEMSNNDHANRPQWMRDTFTAMRTYYPKLRAFNWFHEDVKGFNYTFTDEADDNQGFIDGTLPSYYTGVSNTGL